MAIFEVYKTVCGDEMIYAIEAENAEAALPLLFAYRNGGADGYEVRPARHNLPTVGEVFALIRQIHEAVKDPSSNIRIQSKNFRRALNNWAWTGFFGNKVSTPGEYYKAFYGSNFERFQIPPEAAPMWAGLVEAARNRGITA